MIDLPESVRRVEIVPGYPGLAIEHPKAQARIALQGAHVMEWTPAGEHAVLYMSPAAVFEAGKPIRGGIPVCWPWFGPHPDDETKPAHGFVRTELWRLQQAASDDDGVMLVLDLHDDEKTRALWPHEFAAELRVRIGRELEVALAVRNTGRQPWTMTGALHSYFHVADVTKAVIHGLAGADYIERRLSSDWRHQDGPVRIDQEVDRIYTSAATVEVEDVAGSRTLVIEKAGSNSTVVWNPWIEKSKRLADLPDDDYPRFLCIETTNAGADIITVPPGGSHTLLARIRVRR